VGTQEQEEEGKRERRSECIAHDRRISVNANVCDRTYTCTLFLQGLEFHTWESWDSRKCCGREGEGGGREAERGEGGSPFQAQQTHIYCAVHSWNSRSISFEEKGGGTQATTTGCVHTLNSNACSFRSSYQRTAKAGMALLPYRVLLSQT
jgi:hypothetical protein